ncbi:hypothetical protein KKE06_04760 [Candidatus Micrarchaeota archaeon]|nr:hypothetical protein [Candidatus Micrarchaeota archaeon]MBU1930747.1 hypothetical protein [Candidatus Micrarchaeota archaeon]
MTKTTPKKPVAGKKETKKTVQRKTDKPVAKKSETKKTSPPIKKTVTTPISPNVSEKPVKETAKPVPSKEKSKKERVKHKAGKEVKARRKVQRKIAGKKRPTFKGRFGKRSIRKKGNKKWQRWRRPRGIDIRRTKEYGRIPRSGYGTSKKIRDLHPSGWKENHIANLQELVSLENPGVVRLKAGIGQKKRKNILKEARKKGMQVLN